eukprot:352803-Chlamydomonas_euryale.AAC.5
MSAGEGMPRLSPALSAPNFMHMRMRWCMWSHLGASAGTAVACRVDCASHAEAGQAARDAKHDKVDGVDGGLRQRRRAGRHCAGARTRGCAG